MPSWLPHVLIGAILVVTFVIVYLVKGDDPAWENAGALLSREEQKRLAAARPLRRTSLLTGRDRIQPPASPAETAGAAFPTR